MAYRESGGGSELVYIAFNGHVFAMDRTTGRRLWAMKVGSSGYTPRIIVENERVFILSGDLTCLDAQTGKTHWSMAVKGTTLFVDGDLVLVGGEGEATAHRVSDGGVMWRDDFKGYGLGWVAFAVAGHAQQADVS